MNDVLLWNTLQEVVVVQQITKQFNLPILRTMAFAVLYMHEEYCHYYGSCHLHRTDMYLKVCTADNIRSGTYLFYRPYQLLR